MTQKKERLAGRFDAPDAGFLSRGASTESVLAERHGRNLQSADAQAAENSAFIRLKKGLRMITSRKTAG
jgi:hypothetical protein